VSPQLAAQHQQSWNLLQGGDSRAAARAFADLVKKAPAFYPAVTGQAYAELANRDYDSAASLFAAALVQHPQYVPALAGRVDALLADDKPLEAIQALEALLAVDPSRAEARTRLEGLRLASIERLVADAQTAAKRGDLAAAREGWTKALLASPESGFMLRELAAVERQAGDLEAAIGHARKAAAIEADAPSHALIGEIELARGNSKEALTAYRRAAELDPSGPYAEAVKKIERNVAFAAMPEAFRAIGPSPQITRGDLAALLGVKLERWLAGAEPPSTALITDVREHWAQRWIMDVARAGLMEVFPNHTFQPGQVVRRGDLAEVVSRTLDRAAARQPALAERWRGTPPAFADLPTTHVFYPAAARAVSAGVMSPDPGPAFVPSRVVAGPEAMATIDRLASLVIGR
jgi:tetratricopeptide (TPR) repeat protein